MRPLRILFIAPYVPSLLRGRSYNLIKHLAVRGHAVTLCAVQSAERERREVSEVAPYCTRVETVRVPLARSLWNCARGLRSAIPLQARYSYSSALRRRVEVMARNHEGAQRAHDVVHIEHLRAVLFGLPLATLPRVFDAVDCISQLFERTLSHGRARRGRLKAWVDVERTRRFEAGLVRQFDRTLTTSEADRQALLELCRAVRADAPFDEGRRGDPEQAITVLSNGVDLEYFQPIACPRDPSTLVYVGRMSYHANITAVLHLVHDVMPLIWRQRPDVRLVIVGEAPTRRVRRLARRHGERVVATGYVADVRPYLAQATVAVNPMVYAVGVQNKVLEAMAMATPVVTSPAGCAALSVQGGEHLLVGRDAGEIADRVLRLLTDRALQLRIGGAGRRYVESHHDWRVTVERLEGIYDEVIARFGRPGG